MDAGKIKNVGESYTDGWKPDNAQKNMEQILTKNNNKVDAVVVENDGMAGGVVAALTAQGLAGVVPVSGQDGDHAAINRIALGTQTVSIWKDAAISASSPANRRSALAKGKKMADIPGVKPFSGGAKHVTVNGVLLTPLAVTKDNLNVIVDKGWITKAEVCAGVKPGRRLTASELTAPYGDETNERRAARKAARLLRKVDARASRRRAAMTKSEGGA